MNIGLALLPILQKAKSAAASLKWRFGCNIEGVRVAYAVALTRVEMGEFANIAHHAELTDARIGKRSSIGRYTKIRNSDLGAYCSISWDVTIGAVGHPLNLPSSHAFSYRAQFGIVDSDFSMTHERVRIGNDVWIGCGAIVMPGVTIGNGAVIGAGAVVTNDVEPYSVVSGVPARFMRYRFGRELIEQLESLCWWDWDDVKLRSRISFFKVPLSEESLLALLEEER